MYNVRIRPRCCFMSGISLEKKQYIVSEEKVYRYRRNGISLLFEHPKPRFASASLTIAKLIHVERRGGTDFFRCLMAEG